MWTCFQLKYILKRLIAGLYDKCTLTFVKNSQADFQNCFIFHSHLQWMRVPVVPHPHKQILSFVFNLSLIDSCVVVSHCSVFNSLVTCNVTFYLACLLSWVLRLLCIFWICSLSDVLGNYFLSVCALSFHSFNSIFHRAEIFIYLICILWIFSFMDHIFIAITKVSLSNRGYLEFFIHFLLEILQFWILHLSMIHCKLIFVKGTRPMTRLNFFLYLLVPVPFVKQIILSAFHCFCSCVRDQFKLIETDYLWVF